MMGIARQRIILLGIAYIVVFLVILLQLISLQIVRGKEFDELSQRRLLRESNIEAPRGNILDRNNNSLAENRMGYSVSLVRSIKKSDEFNGMIYNLLKIFIKNKDIYNSTLDKYLTTNPIDYGPYIKGNTKAIEKWKSEILQRKKDIGMLKTPQDIFRYLRGVKYNIGTEYTDEDAYRIMQIRYEMQIGGATTINPIFIARDVRVETVAEIEERHFQFPGVSTEIVPIRRYVEAYDEAHVLGYIGKLNAEEFEKNKDYGYGMNEIIGKSGIELYCEKDLRGIDGKRRIEVDTIGSLTDEIGGVSAIPGKNVILTIDKKMQKVAMNSLENNINLIKQSADGKKNFGDAYAGVAVAIDVNSGEILTMASYPTYDPGLFIAPVENKDIQNKKLDVLRDKASPMLNRAISGTYAPGSTYKPITAIAALEEGVITPDANVLDTGHEMIGGWPFYCLEYRMGLGAHGNISLKRALATSCNIYFHKIGFDTGIDKISKWAGLFGFGASTGVDIYGEATGVVANRETKKRSLKEQWWPADTAQAAIGQMNNAFTPLQLANYVAAIGNGGKLYTPHLIKKVEDFDGKSIKEVSPKYTKIPIKPETINAIKDGMVAVTNAIDGTAVQVFLEFPFQVAGKTGTPETGLESRGISSNGLFICYAPADKPRIAIAVVLERGVWGANAAPVARDIMKEYFGMNRKLFDETKVTSEALAEWVR